MMDNLTDASALIAELTSKLAELDRKVSVYRLGMAAEFTKHSEELLKNVPDDVAYYVSRAIEESLPNFPSLYPPGSLQSPTSTSHKGTDWHGNKSPPPILPHTSGQPKEPQNYDPSRPSQNIQRERDQEFSGLFVPSYLPLLESIDRPPHLPTAPLDPNTAATEPVQSSDGHRERHRPSPLRRATDTSVDSVASDTSSAKTRKSALRRSSTASNKADSPRDPRRVRFDFEGKEFLPSSSPQKSTGTLINANPSRPRDQSALADDSYTTSVGDIAGEQDEPIEKPKKVSSTQALRALSKEPLDEGTVWTVVNPGVGSEESSDTDKVRYTPESCSPRTNSLVSDVAEKMSPRATEAEFAHSTLNESKKDVQTEKLPATVTESEEEQSESDDEPALFMVSKKGLKKKSKGTTLQHENGSDGYATKLAPSPRLIAQPQVYTTSSPAASAPTATTSRMLADAEKLSRSVGQTTSVLGDRAMARVDTGHKDARSATTNAEIDDDDDELFAFDGDERSGKAEKYLPESHDEDAEVDEMTVSPSAKHDEAHNDLPSSPPINVPARAPPSQEHRILKKVPPQSERTRQPSMSIGSLGNRPITAGPVKDPELLEKASKLDVEVPFFVGSVNGRSGPDASNVKSYQASMMSPTQTAGSFVSGSFAERLMWEKSQGILYDSDAEDKKKERGSNLPHR